MKKILIVMALGLAACGPVSPELAAEQCEERANAAVAPTGSIGIGINSDGNVGGGLEVGISTDYIRGRDPYELYETCVFQKTGAGPVRPLVLREGLLR